MEENSKQIKHENSQKIQEKHSQPGKSHKNIEPSQHNLDKEIHTTKSINQTSSVIENHPSIEQKKEKQVHSQPTKQQKPKQNHHNEQKPPPPANVQHQNSKKETQQNLKQYISHFKKSKGYTEVQSHLKKIKQFLGLIDHHPASNLQINLGLGENKGKTSAKFGIQLKENLSSNFGILIEVKIKKKNELKAMIQADLKRAQKAEGFHLYKLCKITFTESQKSLKIHLSSPLFEEHVFKDTIHFIQNLYKLEKPPVLKVNGQLYVKNSIRNDEVSLQKKLFVKWLGEGLTSSLHIQGSKPIITYFTSFLAQYFAIFKVIQSGQINLKLKNVSSIDKLFQKLGINQIAEQTPTLHAFVTELIKQHLSSQSIPWVSDLVKKCILFSNTVPNQKISVDIQLNISHLYLDLSFSSEACKELGQIVNSFLHESFS